MTTKSKPTEFQQVGDICQSLAFAAYDKRVEVLEQALRNTLAVLAGKSLTDAEHKIAQTSTDVLNAKE
jgi:hypothetical protein